MSIRRTSIELVPASHPGPVAAVTVLSALLAASHGLVAGTAAPVVGAVPTGQLSIGRSNNLIDVARDRRVGRKGKPLASGSLLGVGAHLVHILPDLFDAAVTGLRGLPHHVGLLWTPPVAVGAR